MNIDVANSVRQLPLSSAQGLMPLYEAVVNSFHAIDDSGRNDGRITVTIKRDQSNLTLPGADASSQPVVGFLIEDNGVGFTPENFESFGTAYSQHKVRRGAKGVGRFTWLKVFSKAVVRSGFRSGEQIKAIEFEFNAKPPYVHVEKSTGNHPKDVGSVVELAGVQPDFREKLTSRLQTIAGHLVSHCSLLFSSPNAPKVWVQDGATGDSVNLNDLFAQDYCINPQETSIQCKGQTLRVRHTLLRRSGDLSHQMHLCANDRPVKSVSLAKHGANLEAKLKLPDRPGDFVYAGHVGGEYLDAHATQQRTGFQFPDEGMLAAEGNPTFEDIVDATGASAHEYLKSFIEPIRAQKAERIRRFVEAKPLYRAVVRCRPELVENIPAFVSDDRLEAELFKANQTFESQVQEKRLTLQNGADNGSHTLAERQASVESFLKEWDEIGMSKLAHLVAYRHATISFLESRLSLAASGKYSREDAIHEVFMPLKATSDDIPKDQINLWLLDEKLAFHHFLASDKPLREMTEVIQSESADRPDIAIFNKSMAFVDAGAPYSSVVIVEFKKPMRKDYADTGDPKDNPISQVLSYVRQIKAAKALDVRGRPVTVASNTPFFAYVLADLTDNLREVCENHTLTATFDNLGYFGFISKPGVYIEVIGFDKVVADAKKRNQAFFDQLGLRE